MTAVRKTERAALLAWAALPVDDWQPEHWDTQEAARAACAGLFRRLEYEEGATREAAERTGKAPARRQQRPRKPPELIAGEAAAARRSGGRCEHPEGCTDTATVHHHRAGRTRHGAEFLMHLCDHHHRHVHANPEESYANGAMLHRHGIIHDPLGWAS